MALHTDLHVRQIVLASALFLPCVENAIAQTLDVHATSVPTLARGDSSSIEFTESLKTPTLIYNLTIVAPEGVLITSVGPGSTGSMPPCRVQNTLPSSYISCVSTVAYPYPYNYFPFLPTSSLKLGISADPAANLGAVQGRVDISPNYGANTTTNFTVSVQPGSYPDDPTAHSVSTRAAPLAVLGAIFIGSVVSTSLFQWYIHSTKIPTSVMTAGYSKQALVGVSGRMGSLSGEYAPVGKLFAFPVTPTGATGVAGGECSGAVVPSVGRNLIITAAHCLVLPPNQTTQGVLAPNLTFCPNLTPKSPGRTTVENPLGCPADSVYSVKSISGNPAYYFHQVWDNAPDEKDREKLGPFDVAFVQLQPNKITGKNVEDVTGSYGLIFNSDGPTLPYSVLAGYNGGYGDSVDPTGAGGRGVVICTGKNPDYQIGQLQVDAGQVAYASLSHNVDACRFRLGASGGPWLARSTQDAPITASYIYAINAGGVLHGVLSLGYWTGPNTDFYQIESPVLRSWVQKIYESVSGLKAYNNLPL